MHKTIQTITFGILLLALSSIWAEEKAPPQTNLKKPKNPLAARILVHEARNLIYSTNAPASRAERIIALCCMAERMDPEYPKVIKLLADVCELQGNVPKTVGYLSQLIKNNPNDYGLAARWLKLELSERQTAADRIKFLISVSQRNDFSAVVKSQALSQAAMIRYGQAEIKRTRELLDRALVLDPLDKSALSGKLQMLDQELSDAKAQPADIRIQQAKCLLAMLRSNPNALSAAWEMSILLGNIGLADESLKFMRYVWDMSQKNGTSLEQLSVQYFNALLDAGKTAEAITIFRPIISSFRKPEEIKLLLVEAYKEMDNPSEASKISEELEKTLFRDANLGARTHSQKAKLAWFYLLTGTNPPAALKYAKLAQGMGTEENSPMKLLLGAAKLQAGRQSEGMKTLESLKNDDLYADAFLARFHVSRDQEDLAQKCILNGASLDRRGRPWRMLLKSAGKAGIEIPPKEGTEKIFAMLSNKMEFMKMGLAPEEFISVELKPVKDKFTVGSPIEMDVILSNISTSISKSPVPLGTWGLVNPAMSITVQIDGRSKPVTFTNLPMVVWAAPRYLQPGQSITARYRIDCANLCPYLLERPLENLTLKISGTLDPVSTGSETVSAVSPIKIKPVTIVRSSMLALTKDDKSPDDKNVQIAWNNMLGEIVADMSSDDISKRLISAARTGSLLTMIDQAKNKRRPLPDNLKEIISRRVILRMMIESLKDPAAVVRAEMFFSISGIDMDDEVLQIIAGFIDDPSPLVRLAVAQLIGVNEPKTAKNVLHHISNDKDEIVRKMAEAFLEK